MKRFRRIYLEITNVCNLSCGFCPKTDRPAQFMDRESFEKILQKIEGRCEFLYLHVMGEPLLHPEIDLFLNLCRKYNFKVNITTNGTLIAEKSALILTEPALRQVNFSLHSFESNMIEYPLESYIDKIFEFIRKAKSERKLLIGLRLWNVSENGRNQNNVYILKRIQKEFNPGFTLENMLTPINGVKLAENIFLHQAPAFEWPDTGKDEIGSKGFCYGLRDQAAVLSDGTVVPCCLDGEGTVRLGNILENEFTDIINSRRARELYEGFSKREAVEELCRKCGYRTRFDVKNDE